MTDIPEWALFLADDVQNEMLMSDERHCYIIARALVAAHERGKAEGVAQERERAAVLAETQWGYDTSMVTMSSVARSIAAAIRKGANHE